MVKLYLVGFNAPDVVSTPNVEEAGIYTERDRAQEDCRILTGANVSISLEGGPKLFCRRFQVEEVEERFVVSFMAGDAAEFLEK
jgi:hypothetical protein